MLKKQVIIFNYNLRLIGAGDRQRGDAQFDDLR